MCHLKAEITVRAGIANQNKDQMSAAMVTITVPKATYDMSISAFSTFS